MAGLLAGLRAPVLARPAAAAASPTTISFDVRRIPHQLVVTGTVSPNLAGKELGINFFRKHDGRWYYSAFALGILDQSSAFSQSLGREGRRGTCRVIVKYAGDALHPPASSRKTFLCGSP